MMRGMLAPIQGAIFSIPGYRRHRFASTPGYCLATLRAAALHPDQRSRNVQSQVLAEVGSADLRCVQVCGIESDEAETQERKTADP